VNCLVTEWPFQLPKFAKSKELPHSRLLKWIRDFVLGATLHPNHLLLLSNGMRDPKFDHVLLAVRTDKVGIPQFRRDAQVFTASH